MADFNQKISAIREDLDSLLGTIRNVETELQSATTSFAELAANAKDISTLTSAIQKLSKFLDSNKSPFLDEIKDRVKTINTELSKLNVGQLQTATTALEANAKAMAAISRAQANTNRNLETAKTAIAGVRSELTLLETQSGTAGSALEVSVGRIQKSLENIGKITTIGNVVAGLNQLDPTKYNLAADALDRIAATMRVLKQANISIDVSAAAEGQKLSKKPIQPVVKDTVVEVPVAPGGARTAPQARPRTVQFAQERGVDLNDVSGTGARGLVTKEDVLSHIQANAPTVNAAAAAAKSAEARKKLEARISNLNKLDDALAAIETAQDKAFQAALKEHGGARTSSQRDIARKYLLPKGDISPDETRNRKIDFEEIRKNKTFDDLETEFQRQLRTIEVKTNLPDGLDTFKANDTKIIDKIKKLRDGINAEAERLSKEIAQGEAGPSFALSHVFNNALGRKDKSDPTQVAIDERAKARVKTDTSTGAFYTKGNGVLGATRDEAAASLAAIDKAVELSPHKIAVVTTTGTNAGAASAIPGAGAADHVLLFFKGLDGKLQALEHLGDPNRLANGNRTGNVLGGAYAQDRRTPEEVVTGADSVKALPLIKGTAEQAQRLIQEQTNLTQPGKSVYSFANELNHSDLVAIGDTCATATAEAFERSGILKGIEQNSKFANVPGTQGTNLLTPDEVLVAVAKAQNPERNVSPLTKLKEDAILALPGNGTSAQYKINRERGFQQGEYWREIDPEKAEGRVDRNPYTGKYTSHGDKIVGTTGEDAAATRRAILSAIADSEHGIALVGVSGRSAGGKSASTYDSADASSAADHALVAYLENGIVKVAELLAGGDSGLSAKSVTGKDTALAFHPGADSFEDVVRTWDYGHAVPVNGITPEQADKFKSNLVENSQEGTPYGLTKTLDDAGKLIGESCVTMIAKSGREAGILKPDYGLPNAAGENTLQPSAILKLFEARNEEYRRGTATQAQPDVGELDKTVQHLSGEFNDLDTEYKRLTQARKELLLKLIASDEGLKADLDDLAKRGEIKNVESFVDNVASARYASKSKVVAGKDAQRVDYYAETSGITAEFDDKGIGNNTLFGVEDKRGSTADLLEIQKAKLRSAQQAQQDRLLLQTSRPTTNAEAEEKFASFVGTTLGRTDAIKNDISNAKKVAKEYIDRFVSSLKDIFQRINGTFGDLFGSISKISFGDIASTVKQFFKAPTSESREAAPAFALTDVKDTADKFSKNVYRPVAFGVSQFGAGLNSVREIAGGAKEGGAGGALDIIGGIIKLLHTIANTNAFFGAKLLPKGVGEIFNQRRSETLLDIAEIGVGAATGYRRTPVDKTYRALAAQERPLAEKVVDLREQIETAATGGAGEGELLALRQELAKNVEELRQLRSQINAYRVVIAREAEEEGRKEPSQSTGKALDPAATPEFALSKEDATKATYGKIKQFTGENETLLSAQASASLQRFSAGTGLSNGIGGGVAVVQQQNALEATKQFFSQQAIGNVKNSQIQGLSVPVLDEVGKRISSVILTTAGQNDRRAGVLVHEATHELVEQSGRAGNPLYTGTSRADYALADSTLEAKRQNRIADVNTAGQGGANADYLFDPREMFAHIGEALISGNTKLEAELRKLYGDDLYNDVVRTLESTLPDTFAPQYLQGLQAKFATFNSELETIFKGSAAPDVDLGQVFGKLLSSFNIPPAATKNIQDKLSSIFPAIGDVARNPESIKRLTEAATPLLLNEDSFKGRALSAVQKSGGGDLLKQALSTFQNPSNDNVDELLRGVKKSPQIIQKALQSYIAQALNIDESILAKVPKSSLGKIAGLVINQFTPDQANFRDTANEKIQALTGRNLKEGTFQQSASVDTATGVEHFSLSAQSATGAMISLNGHIDEFGHKKLDEPEKQLNKFSSAIKEISTGAFRQIGDSFTYGLVNSFQEMFRQLVSIQDELGEVANLLGVVGDKATQAKSKFLFQSVGVAVKTGQGFDEAIQTNLKNFKILGSVKDPNKREDLANQVSEVQLGAQTAFGISLEQSLESIPAILATIKDGMEGIDDPAQKVTASIGELRDVMDQVVVAQRTTGAQGDELLTVYSRLAASAKDYGLNSKQLLGITATSSVAIGKGSDETSNILRSFLEGTYSSANQGGFAKNGIATQQFNTKTNQLENRSFENVLKDLYSLSQDKSKSIDYNQLLQSIAGPKLAPDISKVIQGFGSNYTDVYGAIDKTPKGAAQTLVAQKSQNFAGSLNKLEATGTQFLGSLLVGTGGFDSAAKLFDKLSESAVKLTSFLNSNEGSIKKVVSALAPLIEFFTIGFATKDLNIFSPLAKGIQAVETKFSGTISKLTDFGRVGESESTQVQKVLNLIGVALEELDASFLRTGNSGQAAFSKIAESAAVAGKAIQGDAAFALTTPPALINPYESKPTLLNPYEANIAKPSLVNPYDADKLGNKALNTSGITQAAQREEQLAASSFSLRDTADDVISTAGKPSKLSQIRQGLQKPGAAAGALVAPVAFDLISGGLGKDNLVNVGAGIAGGIAGAFAGGPYGAIIGYSIGKSISQAIDIPGIAGTSDTEATSFAEKLAEVVFNKKPAADTPEEQIKNTQVAAGQLSTIQEKLGVNNLRTAAGSQELLSTSYAAANNISSNTVKKYLDFQEKNGHGPGFFEGGIGNKGTTEQTIGLFAGNKQLLDLFAGAGVSSVTEFLTLLDQASRGVGPLADEFTKLSIVTQQQAAASADVAKQDIVRAQYQSSQELIQNGQQQQTDLETKLQNDYTTPYGLDTYNAFGPTANSINKSFAPDIAKINSGALSGQDAQGVLDKLSRSQESLAALPQTLQQIVPLAQSLGLNSKGLEQRLYNVGAEGQGQITQRFAPAIDADRSVQLYELQRTRLASLQRTDQFKAKDPAILAEVAALQKALATDKARYDINKAFLELLKGQSSALLDQTAQVEAQQKTRQLISAGTAAQFTPASIFDTKGTTATELNSAIDFALRKQSKLEALNPAYKKEFAKDQFLLQSGTDFKGVTGVNQGFVQEYLQQQQQQKEAPLQDLSQYSDQQIQKILEQARSLQGQAEKLDPAREGKYDNERILILKKNNDLLSQTGIGQEFLKAAIDANTKSNDTLRGHYNLPSDYKSPTIFDYYDNGGKQKGDQNFPNGTGQGLVPLSFAQELAKQLISGDNGDKSPSLVDIKGTNQAGAAPLFYPNPGTAAVYSEVEPAILPDTIKSDKKISDAVQRFFDFKQRQIEDFDIASGATSSATAKDKFNTFKQNQADARDISGQAGSPTTVAQAAQQAAYNQLVNPNQPYFGAPKPSDALQPTTTINGTAVLQPVPLGPAGGGGAHDVVFKDEGEKTKTTLAALSQSSGKARDDLAVFGTGAQKAGTAIGAIATSLPAAGIGAASLVTGAAAFNGAITALIAKVAAFDLAQTLRNANVQIQVTVNGQAIPAGAAQVTINSSASAGTNTLSAGPAVKTGSKIGGNRS
jgi:hypothetical protein